MLVKCGASAGFEPALSPPETGSPHALWRLWCSTREIRLLSPPRWPTGVQKEGGRPDARGVGAAAPAQHSPARAVHRLIQPGLSKPAGHDQPSCARSPEKQATDGEGTRVRSDDDRSGVRTRSRHLSLERLEGADVSSGFRVGSQPGDYRRGHGDHDEFPEGPDRRCHGYRNSGSVHGHAHGESRGRQRQQQSS